MEPDMGSGDGRVSDGSYQEEAEVVAAGGDCLSGLANGDGHGSQEAKPVIVDLGEGKVELDCSGESKADSQYSDGSEVFEEAIDDIQLQQAQWQSGPTEDEHVICAVDNGDGGGIVHEENQEPSLAHETEKINQEREQFSEAEDVLAEGQVFSDRKGVPWEVSDSVQEEEDGKEAELRCTNDKEVEGLAGGGVVIEECTSLPVNGETTKSEIDIGEKEESTDFGANSAPIDIQDNGDGGGIVHEENQEPSLAHETEKINQEREKFNEAEDVLAEGHVFSDRKGGPWEVSDSVQEEEDGKEAELRCTNDKEVEGVAGGGVVIEECTSLPVNGETTKSEIEIGEKEESADFGANSYSAPIDIQENGDSAEASADVRDAPEINGLISSHSEAHQTQDAITEKVASFDEETEGLNGGHADSSQTIAEKGDAVQTGACESRVETSEASEATPQFLAGGEEQKHKVERGIPHSSQVKEEVKQDKVTVEDVDESSSSGEDENSPSVQPPPSTTSSFKKSSGPSLPSQPAGLGSSAPLLEPASRSFQPTRINGSTPLRQSQILDDPANGDAEENDETRERLQMIRVKFLRLAHRLGQTPHNVVVAQVLYRLGLAEQLRGSRNTNRAGAFSFDRASAMAEQLEASGQEPLDFSCTIMVIGKTGVGKSATINSIFDEVKFGTNSFQPGTKKVQDIVGTVQGIKVRVIDTPGLSPSSSDQRENEKILHSVKHFFKKSLPAVVLYLDRLDMQSRDYGDVPLLRTITDIFGTSIWFNAIVVLTHAASAPPDGMNGTPLSYEMFVAQRSHVVQRAIRQAAGDMRLMNPVSLVENHSACMMNRAGQRVLPNGQVWKPQLLLLSFAFKILAEANEFLVGTPDPLVGTSSSARQF